MAGAGFVALPAGSLPEATAVLERDAPDLIITDIRLQGYNGLQILAMGSRPIPAIVVTGYPDRSIEADARKMGAEFLLKPISPASLLTLVQQKLDATAPNAIFSATRRYARKPVRGSSKPGCRTCRCASSTSATVACGSRSSARRKSGCPDRCR